MEKKMTSGEIAKKAGVTQKAVRLYDEKGLLKPTEYSEGNYRLYDKEALQILEKIVALKQIGFSLEEIRDNLVAGDAVDIEEALKIQRKAMDEKRWKLEKVITSIDRTLERKDKKLDWDDVAEIVQNVNLDLKADEGHWDAVLHTGEDLDWYVKIFNVLEFKQNEKILDLGCGFSKLWRNNWKDIPTGSRIFAYDLHGSWADDFAKYLSENKSDLPKDTELSLIYGDIEKEETWKQIKKEKKYDQIICHYVDDELKDVQTLIERVSSVLAKDGKFSFNCTQVYSWDLYFKKAFEDIGINAAFIDEIIKEDTIQRNVYVDMLKKNFSDVKPVMIPCRWTYENGEEIFDKIKRIYPNEEKLLLSEKKKIKEHFDAIVKKDGKIIVDTESEFWHCFK